MSFENIIPLPNQIYINLNQADICIPSAVQEAVFPVALNGYDLIAVSKTGTGKTFAYLLPIFSMLKEDIKKPQAVILAPTHELAVQIKRESDALSKGTDIKSALIMGGANIQRQLAAIKEKPQIIIGATGRIIELCSMRKLTLHFTKTIVIDEADRMLSEKNIDQVKAVIESTLKDRRLMFFSASMNNKAMELAKSLSKNAVTINISKSSASSIQSMIPDSIKHIYFECDKRDKIETLRKVIHALSIKKAIVFSGSQNEAETTAAKLNYHGLKAASLCGQGLKEKRRLALEAFRDGRITVLSATDLAARGLDIKGEIFVFCIGIPTDSDLYLHRAGRTGRMNKSGTVITIASPSEVYKLKRIEKSLGIRILKCEISKGKIAYPSEGEIIWH